MLSVWYLIRLTLSGLKIKVSAPHSLIYIHMAHQAGKTNRENGIFSHVRG